MDWLMAYSQIYSSFTALGEVVEDHYVVNDDCFALLQEILYKLSTEDHTLRTYRRAIGFGNNIQNDIVPLLINARDPKIIDETIRLLVNLTAPVECLLSVEVMSRTEIGRHTIFELNNLLAAAKKAFSDSRSTRAIIDRMKVVLEADASIEYCDIVNNCLLLLRNVLHGSEVNHTGSVSVQNKIIWNLFTQCIDKLLLHLIICRDGSYWCVTLVQLISLLYKDQQAGTLQKLLSIWFEASLSDSSEDNESNTSPPKESSCGSSPMLTPELTSDSSDTGGGNRMSTSAVTDENPMSKIDFQSTQIRVKPSAKQPQAPQQQQQLQPPQQPSNQTKTKQRGSLTSEAESEQRTSSGFGSIDDQSQNSSDGMKAPSSKKVPAFQPGTSTTKGTKKTHTKIELSDCGYSTQVENQESISTSSNEDEFKPVHQKPPPNQKQRFNAANNPRKPVTTQEKEEIRRKKLVKRSRCSIINLKASMHHSPTADDISNVLKEFTVDFLLKGYGHLVKGLHAQLMNNTILPIDTSHFLWLVTYFLKFAAQLELDLQHINTVLCYDIISYLTFEGVSLCEQIELDAKAQCGDLKPSLRRVHLVITAIREFLQALETYNKCNHLSKEDKAYIKELRVNVAAIQDLRCMFVLLLRFYKLPMHPEQYLQDLVTTNHILLLLIDDVAKLPEFKGYPEDASIMQHIKQFATVEIMHHYGLLLQNFRTNGEFVNDCIFTMMHHVGGDVGQASILFQPSILKTFSEIWQLEYEICDDWSDLIEYVIHKFVNTPQKAPLTKPNPFIMQPVIFTADKSMMWTKEEMDTLYWYYIQSKSSVDVIGSIIKLFEENGISKKDRIDVIQQLFKHDIISLNEFNTFMVFENSQYDRKTPEVTCNDAEKEPSKPTDDIKILKDRLLKENKGYLVSWLQKVLMECCFVKLKLEEHEKFKENHNVMEPIAHHYIVKNQSIPLVPWNNDQHDNIVYQPFVLLLHKLGFHLPDDTNRLWVRIPNFWTADMLFSIADKLGPIDTSLFKFDQSHFNYEVQPQKRQETEQFLVPSSHNISSHIRCTPEANLLSYRENMLPRNQQTNGLPTGSLGCSLDSTQLSAIVRPLSCLKSPKMKLDELENILEMAEELFVTEDQDERIDDIEDDVLEIQSYEGIITLEEHEVVSYCETASVCSEPYNLMYVSDEDAVKTNPDV